MTTLNTFLQDGQLGLTVYSPDAAYSRLWGNLDLAIQEATGFQIAQRHWINHDVNSVRRFYGVYDQEESDPQAVAQRYEQIPPQDLQPGHMVVRLLVSGPSLLTLWQGEDAIPTLLNLKGQTHPALADPTMLRGRFWCDTAVCNLVHSSDDIAEVKRELEAVDLRHLLDTEPQPFASMTPIERPSNCVAHCALSIVCDVVNRVRILMPDVQPIPVLLPESGDARETVTVCTGVLEQMMADQPDEEIVAFIESYLEADVVGVTQTMENLPVTPWERFVIQCGALTREDWRESN